MRIAVVGPGATGLFFASSFAAAGFTVVLVDHDPERAAFLNSQGITQVSGEERVTRSIPVVTHPGALEPFDLALLTVKAGQTAPAARLAKCFLAPEGQVLTLQNGIGAGEILGSLFEPSRVLLGTTSQGVTLLSCGAFRRGGEGPTRIGALEPGGEPALAVVDAFNSAGIPAVWEERIESALWLKLAINCGINAITALTNVRNGGVALIPDASALALDAVAEVAAVAKALSIALPPAQELGARVLEVAVATGKNRSSMGQDVDRHRPTEIEFINGALVREAEREGIEVPVNRTLARLVRTLEAGYAEGSKEAPWRR